MSTNKIIGVVLLALGAVLLYFGYQSSQAVGNQLMEAFTGRFSDSTMWYLLGGAAAVVAGVFLAFFKKG